jgi:hypothetical protein
MLVPAVRVPLQLHHGHRDSTSDVNEAPVGVGGVQLGDVAEAIACTACDVEATLAAAHLS